MKQFDKPDLDADLKLLIQSIYEEHQGRYGYRRIRDELVNREHRIQIYTRSDE
ncbi:transposase [Paenibacillus xylanexedens]|nr:transposase [Paenibacillus xylanexedens]